MHYADTPEQMKQCDSRLLHRFLYGFRQCPPPHLNQKIIALNINRKLKKWLMEYLTDRSHCTIANNTRSNQSSV